MATPLARIALALDVTCVAAFVVLGRMSHDEGLAIPGLVVTALPFLGALAVGWVAARAWRAPIGMLTGTVVLVVTVVGGSVLRATLTGRDTPLVFVLVTAAFLGVTMLGWRRVAALVLDRRGVRA